MAVSRVGSHAVTATPTESRHRLAYLDNLKVILVASVIVVHAGNAYGTLGWPGGHPSRSGPVLAVVWFVNAAANLFAMGTFFFIAGWLTPASLVRKGSGRFIRDRLVRLGIPLALSVLMIWPACWFFGVLVTTGNPTGAWKKVGDTLLHLDPGVAWFLTDLLIFSVLFAAYRHWRPAKPQLHPSIAFRALVIAAAVIAVGSFGVRMLWPISSVQPLGLHLWLWPQCVTLFWLGAIAAERGWLESVSRHYRNRLLITVFSVCFAMGFLWIMVFGTTTDPNLASGWHLQALPYDLLEGVVSVCLAILIVDWFHRQFNRQDQIGRALSADAYAAYIVQAPVLVAGVLLLGLVPLAGDLKLAVLPLAGVVGSYAAAHLLRRVPTIRRII